jgi:hypothetical protein
MTRTPSLLADLLADCDAHGVRLALADGGGLEIDAPQDALTPDLLARLKAHKADLLAILRPAPEVAPVNQADAAAVWQAALDRLEGDPLFPPDVLEGLRAAEVRWIEESPDCDLATEPITDPIGPDGWPVDCIDPDELTPCPKCGTLELWQSAAGDLFGLTPGRWRCMKCDPPTAARRLAEAAERIRRRANRRIDTRQSG